MTSTGRSFHSAVTLRYVFKNILNSFVWRVVFCSLRDRITCFVGCFCDGNGVSSGICDKRTGACLCAAGYTGNRCTACSRGYYGFPRCRGMLAITLIKKRGGGGKLSLGLSLFRIRVMIRINFLRMMIIIIPK